MSLKMKRLELLRFGRYISIVSLCILSISIISIPVFAQQMSFTASLSGQSLTPPVSTTATGTAKFSVDAEGNMDLPVRCKKTLKES